MKIAIVGAAGRMGRKLCELAPAMGLDVVSKVDIADGFDAQWAPETEGVVDFSHHSSLAANIARAAASGIPYVIGTTGITPEEQRVVDDASKAIPVVQSGNYSLGVNILLELVEKSASLLGEDYDIEITEMHHCHKKDAPSGTALMLAKAAASGRKVSLGEKVVYGRQGDVGERPRGEIAVHALRGGSVVGDHTVMFAGELERIELTHKAQDRAAFAAGALRALVWACGRTPKIYTMRHVLGFA